MSLVARRGYTIARRAVSPELCEIIRAEAFSKAQKQQDDGSVIAAFVQRVRALWSPKESQHTTLEAPYNRAVVALDMLPPVDAAMRALLAGVGTDELWSVGLTPKSELVELSVMIALPRCSAQPPHVDVLPRDSLAMGTLFCALQDTTTAMGSTVLYPAPPDEVRTRCDFDSIQQSANRAAALGRTFGPDGEEDATAESLLLHVQAEARANGADVVAPQDSHWFKYSSADLGLGTATSIELSIGDSMLMDFRTFHYGGANTSAFPRAQLYVTFREGDDGGRESFMMLPNLIGKYRLEDFLK